MQHLDCCLDVMRCASDCDELKGKRFGQFRPKTATVNRKYYYPFTRPSTGSLALCTFGNLDVACAHLPDLIDLLTAFSDDVSDEIVRNVD